MEAKINVPKEAKQFPKIEAADFIRAIATLGIIIYHFSCMMESKNIDGQRFLQYFPTGDWGAVFVTIFFALSGAMLYYKDYNLTGKIKMFYFKRWISIFPAFYLAWLYFYIQNYWQSGNFLWGGKWYTLLLTLFGMDGYLGFLGPNFYILGEWFLGAILILYILYPLILFLFNQFKIAVSFILIIVHIILIYFVPITDVEVFRAISTCILSFWLGILCMEYRETILENVRLSCILLILFTFLITTNVIRCYSIKVQLTGIILFIILFCIGKYVMSISLLRNLFGKISKLSFPIYLLHHVILNQLTTPFYGQTLRLGKVIGLLVFNIIVILWEGWALYHISRTLMQSWLVKKIQTKL